MAANTNILLNAEMGKHLKLYTYVLDQKNKVVIHLAFKNVV